MFSAKWWTTATAKDQEEATAKDQAPATATASATAMATSKTRLWPWIAPEFGPAHFAAHPHIAAHSSLPSTMTRGVRFQLETAKLQKGFNWEDMDTRWQSPGQQREPEQTAPRDRVLGDHARWREAQNLVWRQEQKRRPPYHAA